MADAASPLNPKAAWPFPQGRKELEAERDALIKALRKVIRVSDEFVEETGLKHGDPLTDAVDEARALIARLK
jgi:hypothetical protein